LDVFEEEVGRRRHVADRYGEALSDVVEVPVVAAEATSVWAQYTVRSAARDRLRGHLSGRGIATAVHYPTPLHLRAAYRSYPAAPEGLAVSEKLCAQVLSLPVHPYLDATAVARVVAAVREAPSR
jgi:dTDP-4-amino-4,6-dideoxygalactose transaminase